MKRLTKEQLQAKANFNFREEEVLLPELGHGDDAGIVLRTPSVAKAHVLEIAAGKRKDEDRGISSPDVVSQLLEVYCAEPEMTKAEWSEQVKGWPSSTLDRIYEACANLAGASEEDSRALATEFRGS